LAELLFDRSPEDAVVQIDHPVAEVALIQQLKVQPYVVGQCRRPTSHDDGGEEELTLID
jgi:hypothetical protein